MQNIQHRPETISNIWISLENFLSLRDATAPSLPGSCPNSSSIPPYSNDPSNLHDGFKVAFLCFYFQALHWAHLRILSQLLSWIRNDRPICPSTILCPHPRKAFSPSIQLRKNHEISLDFQIRPHYHSL